MHHPLPEHDTKPLTKRGFALTVLCIICKSHDLTGRTVDTVIAAMEAKHPNLTTQQMLYVEISRARDRADRSRE